MVTAGADGLPNHVVQYLHRNEYSVYLQDICVVFVCFLYDICMLYSWGYLDEIPLVFGLCREIRWFRNCTLQ